MNISELFKVSFAFEQSHLIFPRIIHWILLILFVVIAIRQGIPYLRDVRNGKQSLPFVGQDFDKLRFFGTIALTVIYVLAMDTVGKFFPNTGLGFLLMSMPYMFLLSLLYLHQRDRKNLMWSVISALVAPAVAWYALTKLFGVTLP